MTWLKKFAQVAFKIIGVAIGEFPLLNATIGSNAVVQTVEDWITRAYKVILTAEQMFSAAAPGVKMGAAKLKASTPMISALVQDSAHFKGREVKNKTLYTDAVTRLTTALADIGNSYGD